MRASDRHRTGTKRAPRTRSLRRPLATATSLFLGAAWLGATIIAVAPAVTAHAEFPRPVSVPLSTPFQMIAEGNTLSGSVAQIRERTGLRIWMDRRVDPSLPLLPGQYGTTTRDVIERLATENSLEVGTADEIVLLGPEPNAHRAASEMIAAGDRLKAWHRKQASPQDSPLIPRRPIAWPMLTTPEEALAIVADSWDLDISAVSLPHDLWPAVDLGEVEVTTALGVIGAGFDLALDLEPATRRITARPLRNAPPTVRKYPAARIPPEVRRQIASPEVGGELRKQDERWWLRGPARAHAVLETALSERAAVNSGPGVTASADAPRFSLRLVNKPAGDFLRAICQSAGWQLKIDAAASDRMTERINLEVDEATLDELIEQALAPLGLEARRQGTLLEITTAP